MTIRSCLLMGLLGPFAILPAYAQTTDQRRTPQNMSSSPAA